MAQDPDFAGFATLGAFAGQALPAGEELAGRRWRWTGLKLDPGLAPARGVGRRAAAGGAGEDPRRGAGPDAARRADQPSRHRGDRLAGGASRARPAPPSWWSATTGRSCGNLTDRTLWVDRGEVRRLDRGFAAFEAWRDKVFEEEDAARHKLDRLIRAEGRWAVEGISARRKRNQGRVRRLAELRAERRDAIARPGTARLDFEAAAASGRLVVEAEGVAKGFGGRELVRDFSIRIGARRAGGAGRAERGRQDDAAQDPDRGAARRTRGRVRLGREPGAGGVRPEPRGARPRGVALGDADRRRARAAATTR